jgi:hypothetical protein
VCFLQCAAACHQAAVVPTRSITRDYTSSRKKRRRKTTCTQARS